jgi:hypothetical protein
VLALLLIALFHSALCVRIPHSLPQPQADVGGADSDEDWSMGSKKGKKGKAAASAKGKGSKAAANSSSSGAAAGGKQQKGGADVNSILSVNVLAQQVLKLYPDMEDAGECCMLLSSKIILYTIIYYYIVLYYICKIQFSRLMP